jgi:hypothetical protein
MQLALQQVPLWKVIVGRPAPARLSRTRKGPAFILGARDARIEAREVESERDIDQMISRFL